MQLTETSGAEVEIEIPRKKNSRLRFQKKVKPKMFDQRECTAQDVSFNTISTMGVRALQDAVNSSIGDSQREQVSIAWAEVSHPVFVSECPFAGEVEFVRDHGFWIWTCPVCGHEYQEEEDI